MLALETSTEACSAALYYQDTLYTRDIVAPRQHASLILNMCQELLSEAGIVPSQLFAVAFGCGPGSFTGVRIAAAAAQGIAAGQNLPVLPVSSLQALAQTTYSKTNAQKVIAGIDARMNEVYLGKFILENNIMTLIETEILISVEKAAEIRSQHQDWHCAGSAFEKSNMTFPLASAIMPIALHDWQANKFVSAEKAFPVYLRNKVT
jgi:tRNA threonylcarbamoyladenosine biosynthesis protein TsaB